MKKILPALILTVIALGSIAYFSGRGTPRPENSQASTSGPIRLHPSNPHYFLYNNQPTILITSAEHYGAVINLDFDYGPYLAELQSKGLNYTRIFTGPFTGGTGATVAGLGFNDTLAPQPNRLIVPWARSTTAGYKGGGNKFNLDQWDTAYFTRLKDFVRQAESRGIIVEVTLFCTMYDDTVWQLSPLHTQNNINGTTAVAYDGVHRNSNGNITARQMALVVKMVTELKDFDNVFYEVINEPYFGNVAEDWQANVIGKIAETEAPFVEKHMIAKNISNQGSTVTGLDSRVSLVNFHYAIPERAVGPNWGLNKAIGDDETGFGSDQSTTRYRREAWDFILSGGALFNNLDYSFTPSSETGQFVVPSTVPGGGSAQLRSQLKILADFMKSFDFIKMSPQNGFIRAVRGTGGTVTVKALAEAGSQYAMWLRNGTAASLDLSLPAGTYRAEWINTQTGGIIRTDTVTSNGSALVTLNSPTYTGNDAALRIKTTTSVPPTQPTFTPSPTTLVTPRPTPTITPRPATPTPVATAIGGVPTATPTKQADANRDGQVNEADYTIWLNNYGKSLTGSNNGDFNNSGKVDGVDYTIWANGYGK